MSSHPEVETSDLESTSSASSYQPYMAYSKEDHLKALKALEINSLDEEDAILALPLRSNKSQRPLAMELAELLYPELTPIAAIIKYELMTKHAKAVIRQRKRDRIQPKSNKRGNLLKIQGPWAGQDLDPVDLNGPTAIPMPVTIGTAENFRPIFNFLTYDKPIEEADTSRCKHGYELQWHTPMIEFERGIVYEDGRLDLCKKVVGPTHIGTLMESLEANHQITHFLLGNNVISTTGAKRIAEFISKYPNRMETWYLAGCHITHHGLSLLVPQMIQSSTITNLWFKRNPFGPDASALLAELVVGTANLRTLDLETTELGNQGTSQFIEALCGKPSALQNLYLNANGIGEKACASLGKYLADDHCVLESLFLSTNPIGDAGVRMLSPGLEANKSLKRLMLASAGITSDGVICLANAICKSEAPIFSIDLAVSQTTKAHAQKFNCLDDKCIDALESLMMKPTMRWLGLGRTMLSEQGIQQVKSSAANSELVYLGIYRVEISPTPLNFEATEVYEGHQATHSCSLELRNAMAKNQAKYYPHIKSYDTFLNSEEFRYLRNTPDVRKIDSHYRTMDKRLGLPMDTPWEEGDPTWKLILEDAKAGEQESL